jgi:hypothetical protein
LALSEVDSMTENMGLVRLFLNYLKKWHFIFSVKIISKTNNRQLFKNALLKKLSRTNDVCMS